MHFSATYGHHLWILAGGGAGEQFVSIFIDDVTISTEREADNETEAQTFERHTRHTELFLERAKSKNIQFKLDKSQFAQNRVKVLGFIVGCGVRSVDPSKVETLKKWPDPKGCDDIVSFLAFVNFLREFVPSFHEHSQHLKPYTKNGRILRVMLRTKKPNKPLGRSARLWLKRLCFVVRTMSRLPTRRVQAGGSGCGWMRVNMRGAVC